MNIINKYLITAVCGASYLAVPAYMAYAAAPGPKVAELGNKHNLSALARQVGTTTLVPNTNLYRATNDATNNPGGQQVCIFCHTPHNANVEGGAPLWNRAFSTQTFSRYSSSTLQIRVNSAARTPAQYDSSTWKPDGSTKLCLSCHDGVSSLGAVLRGGGSGIAMNPAGGNVISSDTAISFASFNPSTNKMKRGHHPVSFVYNSAVASAINTGKGVASYALPALAEVKLDRNSKMQCTTCHDPHQNQSDDADSYATTPPRKKAPFWVYHNGSNTASADHDAVCTTCHPLTSPAIGVGPAPAPWP